VKTPHTTVLSPKRNGAPGPGEQTPPGPLSDIDPGSAYAT
jgi:hypothetical protein